MTLAAQSTLVDRLLDDRTYHIEYNGHLTNHVKHAVVAMAGLGAAPEKIIRFHASYTEMTPYGAPLEPQRPTRIEITADNWDRFIGKRTHFASYCAFFDAEVSAHGMDDVLRRYLPRLLPGWVGSFTHATIHLGWGLDAGSRWMAVEGLAYLAFSYVTCHPERVTAERAEDATAADSLLRVTGMWQDHHDEMLTWARAVLNADDPGIHPELARSGLQYRISRMLTEGHGLAYRVPRWIETRDVDSCWEQLYYLVTLLYLAKPGDFVLLHLITSLYGLERIARRLPAKHTREIMRQFWLGAIAVAFESANVPTRSKVAALHEAFAGAVDAGGPELWAADWARIVARAVEEDEEHNPKLVYVLRQMWHRFGRQSIYRAGAAQFTATPGLPPSFEEPPTDEEA